MASEMAEHGAGEGEGPSLSLPAFNGSLSLLLSLARAQQIDLAQLSLPDLLDQLSLALDQVRPATSLGEKGSWLVMASWLVLLRSRLLLPADTAAQLAAEADAGDLRDRLLDLQAAQSLASWLERRPQLGQDVFARGQPEPIGSLSQSRQEVDVVTFLWACLALFDDGAADANTTQIYTPPWHGLHSTASCSFCPSPRTVQRWAGFCRRRRPRTICQTARGSFGAPPGAAPSSPASNSVARA